MKKNPEWIWLGDHLAVDFANTTIGGGRERIDLITSIEKFDSWRDHEPSKLPQISITKESLAGIRKQRDATARILRNAIQGEDSDAADVELINTAVERGQVARVLTGRPRESRLVAGNANAAFTGVLAAAVVDILAREDLAAIALREAPNCGQIFHRSRVNQKWCSPGCGNRARVDRHRHRNPQANK